MYLLVNIVDRMNIAGGADEKSGSVGDLLSGGDKW